MSTMRIINYSANIKELLLIHRKNRLSLDGNFVADFFTILAGLNVFKDESKIEYYFKDFKLFCWRLFYAGEKWHWETNKKKMIKVFCYIFSTLPSIAFIYIQSLHTSNNRNMNEKLPIISLRLMCKKQVEKKIKTHSTINSFLLISWFK